VSSHLNVALTYNYLNNPCTPRMHYAATHATQHIIYFSIHYCSINFTPRLFNFDVVYIELELNL